MGSFIDQIKEDIKIYQNEYSHISNIKTDSWAFNFWVLDKLFFEDEELIEEKIVDYHDLGIDAYETYEETKDVYLIQNKFYSETDPISAEYVKNDFLIRAITALENGTYKKSTELQSFFTKYKNHEDFAVHLQLFVTNNKRVPEADKYINKFNLEHPKYHAQIFYLDDIEERYFGELKPQKKNLSVTVESVNNGTILKINSESYQLPNVIDARYVFTPVVSVYRIYRDALEKGYPIFDMNIREYLGNKGINKNIYTTLIQEEERKNFFYYNNGITIICDKMHKVETQHSGGLMNASFKIDNPQIVNGCQTVNSIYAALKNVDPALLESEFKDTFVMLKILEIDRDNSDEDTLYKNIVKYNNSQNNIDEKTFVANTSEFRRIQTEFEKRGFLLLIKQSDKNAFSEKYKMVSSLNKLNSERIKRFGLDEVKKASDVFIPLEKLLQIINAFMQGGHIAYKNKSNMLKFGSSEYNTGVNFLKNNTIDVALDLYLLYKRAERTKKAKKDSRFPIPYYLIDGFARFECYGRNSSSILDALSDSTKIDRIIKLYTMVTSAYTAEYFTQYGIDYGKMIKGTLDFPLFDKNRAVCLVAFDAV